MKDIFGEIKSPTNVKQDLSNLANMGVLLNNILRLLIIVAGIYTLLNIILAGYQFIGASGDPKKIEVAWGKIWQSLIGLIIIVGSFALAALLSKIIFGDPKIIFNPKIIGPGN